jgi:hypothetical protein
MATEYYTDNCRKSLGAAIVEITDARVPALIERAYAERIDAADFCWWALQQVRAEKAQPAPAPVPAPEAAPPLDYEVECKGTLSRSEEDELGGIAALPAIVDRAHAAGVTVEAFRAWALGEARAAAAANIPAMRQTALRAMVDYLTAVTAAAAGHVDTVARELASEAVQTCREALLAEAAHAAADAIVAACPRGRVRASVYDFGRELYVTCGDAAATLSVGEDADPRWDGVDLSGRDEGDPSSLRSLLEEIEELQEDAQRVEDCITDARAAVAAWRAACEVSR